MNCKHSSYFRSWCGYVTLLSILLIVSILGCFLGSAGFTFSEFWNGMLGKNGYQTQTVILYHLRIPRVIAGILAGVGLSVSGVLLQSVTGNILASPNMIGVNAGAGFACILLLSLLPAAWYALPFFAFLGALATTLVVIAIANRIHASASTVILSGVACSAILNAGISFLSLLDSDVLSAYNAFSIGGLNGVMGKQLFVPGVIIAICFIVALVLSRQISILCLGDKLASSLGVRVSLLRSVCLICACASAAAVVSYAGLLGFVGLVVPNIAKRLCGSAVGPALAVSAIIGAIIVVTADLFGRILLAPTEIPVGILMAVIGVPFFFALLAKRRRADD